MNLKFYNEKNKLFTILEKYSLKLKFTKRYIKSFNINENFTYYCQSYNDLIDCCNHLKNKLNEIKKWGYIFNTKIYWINKVESINMLFKFYSDRILETVIVNLKHKNMRIFDENYITSIINIYEKLKVFLKIIVINNEYIYGENDVYISIDKDYFNFII